MMVKECRWMKQKVCDGGETPRGYLPPRRTVRSRTWKTEKDPIGQLLEPLANIVHSLLEPIGKLLKQTGSSGRQPRCRMMPKQWCEQTPKERCEPTTKRICKDVGKTKCGPVERDECSLVTRRDCKPNTRNECKMVPIRECSKKLVPKCQIIT